MANKTNKYVQTRKAPKKVAKPQPKMVKKVAKPAAPAPKKVEVVKKPKAQTAPRKKTVRTKKVSINSIPQPIVTEKTNTYDVFGYKVKKSHVWVAVGLIVLLCIVL